MDISYTIPHLKYLADRFLSTFPPEDGEPSIEMFLEWLSNLDVVLSTFKPEKG